MKTQLKITPAGIVLLASLLLVSDGHVSAAADRSDRAVSWVRLTDMIRINRHEASILKLQGQYLDHHSNIEIKLKESALF